MTRKQKTIEEMTFEQAYSELATIIEQMENGDLPLEKTVELYERGHKLAARCEALLENADLRVQTLLEEDEDT